MKLIVLKNGDYIGWVMFFIFFGWIVLIIVVFRYGVWIIEVNRYLELLCYLIERFCVCFEYIYIFMFVIVCKIWWVNELMDFVSFFNCFFFKNEN